MKKKLLVIGCILLVVLLCGGIILLYPKQKIELSKEYYKEEKGSFIEITHKELPKNKNYILFTYNSYCTFPIPCDEVFHEFAEKNQIDMVSIPFSEFRKTDLYPKVKYAPSVIVIKNNKIIAYLDANSDKDKNKYQDVEEFTDWIKKYVELKIK